MERARARRRAHTHTHSISNIYIGAETHGWKATPLRLEKLHG